MRVSNKEMARSSVILLILNITASALNYACQLFLARVLSVESFGTINTIFSYMMIIAVPGTTLTMVVSRYYAEGSAVLGERFYLKKQVQTVLILSLIVMTIQFCASYFLSKLLRINDIYVLIMTIVLAASGFFQPLYSGVFSGKKAFILVGVYSLFIPAYKLLSVFVAGVSSMNDKYRLYIVLFVMIIGVAITAVFGQLRSNKILNKEEKNASKKARETRLYSASDIHTLFLNISLMFYMNVDLLTVRYYENERESGLYSSVLLFGRIIYYFATTLGTILLPSVADRSINNSERKRTLNKALLLMLIISVLCLAPINILKNILIKLLYGIPYLEAAKYLVYVSIISVALSLYTLMINYVVGVGRTKLPTIVMAIVDVLLIICFLLMDDTSHILSAIGIIGIIGAIVIYVGENVFVRRIR